jgi:hypothetical protein
LDTVNQVATLKASSTVLYFANHELCRTPLNGLKASCTANASTCFPLLWSFSPHTLSKAPDWLKWYYKQAQSTGKDWFILPPSGDLYAYPGMMPAEPQAAFVKNTERDCLLMDTSATVYASHFWAEITTKECYWITRLLGLRPTYV